jgi:sugar transferase (PEP-CTERM/EpsH1 system associated)
VVHSLCIGGTERVVCELVRAFNKGEFRTSVCCLDNLGEFGEELRREAVPVHVLGRRAGVDFSLSPRLRRLYREEKVDLIHAHQYSPYFYAATAAIGTPVFPVIFTEHGRHWPDGLRPKRVLANQLLRITTRNYTAVSEFSRQSLIRYERMPGTRVQVVYNGIPIDGLQDGCAEREKLRAEAGVRLDGLVILSIGRMDPIKDFATLIRAFASVRQQVPRASLWIAGDGDSEYRAELLRLAETLGLCGKVRLLGARRDVQPLLRACDLFALSSLTEATSLTVLEAMASGRAVVATDTGGNPELVVHGKTGFLVPVGDIPALAGAMYRLLEDREQREAMGRLGRKRVEEKFALRHMLQQYRDIYFSALGKKHHAYFNA